MQKYTIFSIVLITGATSVNTLAAVDHERHGTTGTDLGQTQAARDAFCKQIIPVHTAYNTETHMSSH